VADITDITAELYALPLEQFTDARNTRAKELSSAGDKDRAAAIKALKKPSVPAWAVDKVARAHPKDLEALFDIGAQLRDAQRKLMRSGDSAAVQDAQASERAAVKGLVAKARGILTDAGHNPNEATLERIADTFYAMAVDEDGRERVRAGTLDKELKRVGFGDIGELTIVPAAGAKQEKPRARSARLEKEAAKLQAKAEEDEAAADEAEALSERLQAEAEQARARADEAREQARFARRRATEARKEAEKAARRADRG
jgi:hypothetical protein